MLRYILKERLRSAKKSAANKKNLQLEDSTLTLTEVLEKWQIQNGRCFISDIDLANDVSQISIERLMNDRAYHFDNIVLIHRKFQVVHKSLHWTREKYNQVFELRRQPISMPDIESHLQFHEHDKTIFSRRKGETKWIPHKNQAAAATYCGIEQRRVCDHLLGIKTNLCFEFEAADYVPRPRSSHIVFEKLNKMQNASFQTTKDRNTIRKKHNKPLHVTPTITVRSLWEQLQAQNFRCFYTGVPLAFEPCADFTASLERLDENLGYTPGNICLIIHELNTASYQWSHEDVNLHWPNFSCSTVKKDA